MSDVAPTESDPSEPGHAFDRTNDPVELRRLGKAWVETAAQHARNEAFYRDIVQQTGRILGRECNRQDDGNYTDEPLALRVPEVAKEVVRRLEIAMRTAHEAQTKLAQYDGIEPNITAEAAADELRKADP